METTTTLRLYNMEKTNAMLSLAAAASAPESSKEGEAATDGEKFLFWQIAKKMCSQKKRAERSAVMRAYQRQRSSGPAIVPTEIGLFANNHNHNSNVILEDKDSLVALGNLLLQPPTTTKDSLSRSSPLYDYPRHSTTQSEDDDDADSCVSDVTRELPDIDAPTGTLYPSLEALDCLDAELPDLTDAAQPKEVIERPSSYSCFQEQQQKTILEEEEPLPSTANVLQNCRPSHSSLDFSLSEQDSHSSPCFGKCQTQKSNEKLEEMWHQQHNWAGLTSHSAPSGAPSHAASGATTNAGTTTGGTSHSTASTTTEEHRKQLLAWAASQSFLRKPAAAIPLPLPNWKRNISESSPVPPQRRLSLDSKISSNLEGYEDIDEYRNICVVPHPNDQKKKSLLDADEDDASVHRSKTNDPKKKKEKKSVSSTELEETTTAETSQAVMLPQFQLPTESSSPEWLRRTSVLSKAREPFESSPTQPQRRLSLDSRIMEIPEMPTREELGYEDTSAVHLHQPTKQGKKKNKKNDSTAKATKQQQRPEEPTTRGIVSNLLAALGTRPVSKRNVSDSFNLPPQRRLSLDSRMGSEIPTRAELEYEDMSVYGRPQIRQTDKPKKQHGKDKKKKSKKKTTKQNKEEPQTPPPKLKKTVSRDTSIRPPSRRNTFSSSTKRSVNNNSCMTPPQRRETLDSSKADDKNTPPQRKQSIAASSATPKRRGMNGQSRNNETADTPRLPLRRNSCSSILSGCDSTIATWTLGLYQRRKSLDSTVAPVLLAGGLAPQDEPDSTPAQPRRRFSASSLMREQFAATESRWNCALNDANSRDNRNNDNNNQGNDSDRNLSISRHTISTLGFSSGPCLPLGESVLEDAEPQLQSIETVRSGPKPLPQHNELEIQPGLFVPLHGRQETAQAMERNMVERTSCMSCETKLFCILGSEYVLCPLCRVVSPVMANLGSNNGYGVGLGVEVEFPSLEEPSRRRDPTTM